MNLLVVDDEPLVRRGVAKMARAHPAIRDVRIAADAFEAMSILATGKTDVVITDIRMPEMDGLQLIQKAKEARYCDLFIVLSSYARFNYAQRAIEYGALGYLLNPVDGAKLNQALDKAWCHMQNKPLPAPAIWSVSGTAYELMLGVERQVTGLPGDPYVNIPAQPDGSLMSVMNGTLKFLAARDTKKNSLRQVLLYTHINCLDPGIALDNIARKFGMHPNYLSASFSKELGVHWVRYLNTLRVVHAQEFFRTQPFLSVQDVAQRCGFETTSHFFRIFKQLTGLTPGEYRSEQKTSE